MATKTKRSDWKVGQKWRVCGKYNLRVDLAQADPTSGHRPFHEFPLEFMGHHAICKERIINSLPKLGSAVELFGGLGLTACCIRSRHEPEYHRVYEKHPGLVRHLRANGFEAEEADAFQQVHELPAVDLVDADFGLFTILQWNRSEELREFTDALFGKSHRFIMFTDEAKARLGPNAHRYAEIIGRRVKGVADYLNGWSELWWFRYHYSMIQVEYNQGACYTLWARTDHVFHVTPNRTEAKYPGVRIIT